jgi:hypothetical protein
MHTKYWEQHEGRMGFHFMEVICESKNASKNKSDFTFSNTKLSAARHFAIQRRDGG